MKNLSKEIIHDLTYKYEEHYEKVKKPTKHDWLWDVKETFQSYDRFSTGIRNSPSKMKNTIYVKNLDVGMESSKSI